MSVLIVGSTGGVGSRVVTELLASEDCPDLKLICRNQTTLTDEVKNHEKVEVIEAEILKMNEKEIKKAVEGCEYVISCLGHRLKKMFSPPYNLCQKSVEKLIKGVKALDEDKVVKFIAINTVGVGNPDGSDRKIRSFMENRVLGALWVLIPPHRDNYRLSHYFHNTVAYKDDKIKWCVVRPDSLHNHDEVEEYDVFTDLQVNLFNPKKSSRRNIARFMSSLVLRKDKWKNWENKYPVVYDKGEINTN